MSNDHYERRKAFGPSQVRVFLEGSAWIKIVRDRRFTHSILIKKRCMLIATGAEAVVFTSPQAEDLETAGWSFREAVSR